MKRCGYLIAGVGLPASGKSTLLRALAEKNRWECYAEPEENEWASAVDGRHLSGIFTALTWFRSTRVPNLYAANLRRKAGEVVIVDSFYDKLMHHYRQTPVPRQTPASSGRLHHERQDASARYAQGEP